MCVLNQEGRGKKRGGGGGGGMYVRFKSRGAREKGGGVYVRFKSKGAREKGGGGLKGRGATCQLQTHKAIM